MDWNITLWTNCKVHWLKKFLYKEMLGFTKNDELFRGMVREEMHYDGRSSVRLISCRRTSSRSLWQSVV